MQFLFVSHLYNMILIFINRKFYQSIHGIDDIYDAISAHQMLIDHFTLVELDFFFFETDTQTETVLF